MINSIYSRLVLYKKVLFQKKSYFTAIGILLVLLIYQNCSPKFNDPNVGEFDNFKAIEILNSSNLHLTANQESSDTKALSYRPSEEISFLSNNIPIQKSSLNCPQGQIFNQKTQTCERPNPPSFGTVSLCPPIIPQGQGAVVSIHAENFNFFRVYDGKELVLEQFIDVNFTGAHWKFSLSPTKTTQYKMVLTNGAGVSIEKMLKTIEVRPPNDPIFKLSPVPLSSTQNPPSSFKGKINPLVNFINWNNSREIGDVAVLTMKTPFNVNKVISTYDPYHIPYFNNFYIYSALPTTYTVMACSGNIFKSEFLEISNSLTIHPPKPSIQIPSNTNADCKGSFEIFENGKSIIKYIHSGYGNLNFSGSKLSPSECTKWFENFHKNCLATNPTCKTNGFYEVLDDKLKVSVLHSIFPESSEISTKTIGVCSSTFYTNNPEKPEMSPGSQFIVSHNQKSLIRDCNNITALSFLEISQLKKPEEPSPVGVKELTLYDFNTNEPIINSKSLSIDSLLSDDHESSSTVALDSSSKEASISISCNTIENENIVSCNSNTTGIKSEDMIWQIGPRGYVLLECLDQLNCRFAISEGTYSITASAVVSGKTIKSNQFTVTMKSYFSTQSKGSLAINEFKISCDSSLVNAGSKVTCNATKNIINLEWFVGSTKAIHCTNKSTCTWDNVPAGNYFVKAIGIDSSKNSFTSNSISVIVNPSTPTNNSSSSPPPPPPPPPPPNNSTSKAPASIKISCSPTLMKSGGKVTCSAVTNSIVSGEWYVNSKKATHCTNKPTCTWDNVPAGNYSVKAIGIDSSNKSLTSNSISVIVNLSTPTNNSSSSSTAPPPPPPPPNNSTSKAPASIKISCSPTLMKSGGKVTCSAVTNSIVSGEWYVNSKKATHCTNKPTCTWDNVPAGNYSVKAVGVSSSKTEYWSDVINVIVKK